MSDFDPLFRQMCIWYLRAAFPEHSEKVEEYIREAEHQEGYGYWQEFFTNIYQAGEDFLLYIREEEE